MTASAPAVEHVSRQRLWLAIVVICAAAIVPYLTVVNDYFIRDDFGTVQLLASKPADYFPRWFYTSWMDNIWGFNADEVRPFPAVSYQLTALGGAGSPVAHHVFNLGLHAANGLLVFAIALLAARLSLPASAFAAVTWVVLPVQAESAAWITGRVDSMPAFFYLASFLMYTRWRDRGGAWRYLSSLAIFFVLLYTKQNAITMVATIAAYDGLAARNAGSLWRRALAYVPFAVLTVAYLYLRLILFGQAAREERLTPDELRGFVQLVDRHLAHVAVGDPDASRLLVWLLLATVLAVCFLGARHRRAQHAGVVLYFGPVWWAIGVAPILVAGYESPRHVYLASVAWALLLGLALEILWRSAPRARRPVLASAGVILLAYGFLLHGVVRTWNTMGMVSDRATRDLRRQSIAVPEGSLLILGVPPRSWEWAMPFAATPPFNERDLTTRSFFIYPRALHCCRQQWFDDTRRALEAWSAGPARDTVVVLRWDGETGNLSRLASIEQPALIDVARALKDLPRADALNVTIERLVETMAGPAR